jgi:hypothetical protein
VPAKSTPKKPASHPEPAGEPTPAEPTPATSASADPAPEPTVEPEPLNRAERRAARRKGGGQPTTATPRGKVARGTPVQAPRQWANRRRSG